MKVDLTIPLRTFSGEPVLDDNNKEVTLAMIATQALLSESREQQAEPSEKLECYLLAQKVHQAEGPVNLKSEEVSLIKKKAGASMTTMAFGALVTTLEGGA
jgi:hypothetical protein